jgi:predicted TPR repeat methyltransferase
MTRGRPQKASSAPDHREALARAIQLHRGGRLDDAEAIYRRLLADQPRDPDALHYLGVLCHQRGQSEEAVALIRQALAAAPAYADAHNNLGNVFQEIERCEEAAGAYRRALALQPSHAPTHNNLGIALRSLGQLADGIAHHRRAIELAPGLAAAHFSLGNALREQGDLPGAIAALRRAIDLAPRHIAAYKNLGRALYRAGRNAEAVAVFEGWLAQDPGNPVALHMRAACSGEDVPARASDGYLRQTFDALAGGFDENLARLQYRAPQLALATLATDAGDPHGDFDVLDAGCGTGLCGPLLRPYARRLVGVDLSTGVLTKARGRGVYDELVAGELTAYLRAHLRTFDVILSADTLVYFGDLGPVLAAADAALRVPGRLVFTVERADPEEGRPLSATASIPTAATATPRRIFANVSRPRASSSGRSTPPCCARKEAHRCRGTWSWPGQADHPAGGVSAEGAGAHHHARDGRQPDEQEQDGHDERQGQRVRRLPVDQLLRDHGRPLPA